MRETQSRKELEAMIDSYVRQANRDIPMSDIIRNSFAAGISAGMERALWIVIEAQKQVDERPVA